MKALENESNVRIINPKQLLEAEITGIVLTGTFIEERVEERKNGKTGKKFTSRSFIFEEEGGKQVIINATGHLSYLMEKQEVQPGDKLSVLYFGKKDPSDDTSPHQFELIAA